MRFPVMQILRPLRNSTSQPARQFPVAFLLAATLCGCSSSNPVASNPINPDPNSKTVYILTGSTPIQVIGLPSGATGTAVPTSVLTLPADFSTLAMTTDAAGEIYVAGISAGKNASEILVYAESASGDASPIRTILTGQPVADLAGSIAVDAAGRIFVSDQLKGEVNVFAADAGGASAPIRTISWDAGVFHGGSDITVDATGALYVAGYIEGTVGGLKNPSEVVVYASGANGSAAPARTLVGSNVQFGLNSSSIAVDGAGNLFAIVANLAAPFLNATEVAEYSPGADGNAVPVKTIVGNFGENGVSPTHLEIDSADNVYVFGQFVDFDLPQTPIPYPPFIATFPATASGATAPSNQFTAAALDGGAYSFSAR